MEREDLRKVIGNIIQNAEEETVRTMYLLLMSAGSKKKKDS